jgi:hypothetical protein
VWWVERGVPGYDIGVIYYDAGIPDYGTGITHKNSDSELEVSPTDFSRTAPNATTGIS